RAEAGPAAEVGQVADRPAGHALHRVVPAAGADDGADDGELVHQAGDTREDLADLDAGHRGGDRLELAADLGGGLGLDLPQVLVGRAAAEEDVDDRLVSGAGAGPGLGAEDVGKGEGAGPEAEGTDLEEAAAVDAV